jgi:hypothetical protein
MNSSYSSGKGLDSATINTIGWTAVVFFAVCLTIFMYRLQVLLSSDIGGLKSVRII